MRRLLGWLLRCTPPRGYMDRIDREKAFEDLKEAWAKLERIEALVLIAQESDGMVSAVDLAEILDD